MKQDVLTDRWKNFLVSVQSMNHGQMSKHQEQIIFWYYLGIFETLVTSKKLKNADFNSLVRKKFIEKAEDFVFLDPFAAEFEYSNREVVFNGDADDGELMIGIVTTLKELAEELRITEEFKSYLTPWREKYDNDLKALQIVI